MPDITLFSSDATVQYTRDVFSVLALPRESSFQFRYHPSYLDEETRALFNGEVKEAGIRALIVHNSKAGTAADKTFLIPIRWANILSVRRSLDFYIVDFVIKGYPVLTREFLNSAASFSEHTASAREILASKKANTAVKSGLLDCVEIHDDPSRDNDNWSAIVHLLALVPQYANNYFLKCSNFYTVESNTAQKEKECEMADYHTKLIEGKCANIRIEYLSANYNKNYRQYIEVYVDEHVLSKSKGLKTALMSGYGSVKLGFQPKTSYNNTVSEITISTIGALEDENHTEVVFPVMITKNRKYKIKKATFMAIGALFVALPGIISESVEIGWNILIASIGVLIMGINNYWESRE